MQKAVEIIPTLDFFEFILFLNKVSPKLKISTRAFDRDLDWSVLCQKSAMPLAYQ